jgi:phage tail-like protein
LSAQAVDFLRVVEFTKKLHYFNRRCIVARAQSTDFLHSMRFSADVTGVGDSQLLIPEGQSQAGFNQVSTPEAQVEAVEYKEGHTIYPKKFPGATTVSDITMSRGVARRDSSFWNWLLVVIEGSGEYRADIDIKHYHRDTSLTRTAKYSAANTQSPVATLNTPARTYHVKEAFPTRHKVAADLDATASDVSIMELDVAYEYFDVENHEVPST